jgi:hypothetical protein
MAMMKFCRLRNPVPCTSCVGDAVAQIGDYVLEAAFEHPPWLPLRSVPDANVYTAAGSPLSSKDPNQTL